MLAELQSAFREALAGPAPPAGIAGDPAAAARRFAVYRNNVARSLAEALATRFPVIERLVGAEFFRALARAHIAESPPASPLLFAWGADFPAFLARFAPVAALPYLPDVARLELARGRAWHAADAAPLPPRHLAEAATAAERLRLRLHPALALVRSRFAHLTIWEANQPGDQPQDRLSAKGPEAALVLRDPADAVRVLRLSPGDAALIEALAAGLSLLGAAEAATSAEPDHDPTSLLGALASCGAIVGADIEDAP